MKSQVSELFDGELDAQAAGSLVGAVARDAEMRESWRIYALIGDQLRNEAPVGRDLSADVMARLREEPVILAPRNVSVPARQHPLLALAASVAGVAVVGLIALGGKPASWPDNRFAAVPSAPTLARVVPEAPGVEVARNEAVGTRSEMRELLLAHQMQASSFRLGDSTEHIRTVAATGRVAAP